LVCSHSPTAELSPSPKSLGVIPVVFHSFVSPQSTVSPCSSLVPVSFFEMMKFDAGQFPLRSSPCLHPGPFPPPFPFFFSSRRCGKRICFLLFFEPPSPCWFRSCSLEKISFHRLVHRNESFHRFPSDPSVCIRDKGNYVVILFLFSPSRFPPFFCPVRPLSFPRPRFGA